MPDIAPQVHPAAIPEARPSVLSPTSADDLDRILHNWQSRFTGGRSPSTVALAFMDWAAHTANTPFKTASFGRTAMAQWQRLAGTMMGGANSIAPQPGDHRFAHPSWQQQPYNLLTQSVLLGEEWWDKFLHGTRGVSPPNARMVAFTMKQFLDVI